MIDLSRINQLAPQIKQIGQRYGITTIYIFGSVARGKAHSQSDVDFLVDLEDEASLFGIAGFGYDLEKLLGVPVDVVPLTILPRIKDQDFAKSIQKDAIAI
jgi:predicted nucleotidyltransferase